MLSTTEIQVITNSPYPIKIGYGLLSELITAVSSLAPYRIAIIHQPVLIKTAAELQETLRNKHFEVHRIEIPDAEAGKDFAVVSFLWEVLGKIGLSRSDLIISLGGGATTDVAGFIAATWMRGVKVFHIPTTLLAMVDASIGGKTGINTAAGKNLVGSFYEPAAVFVDLAFLTELPLIEIQSGLAEVIKAGLISDPKILDLILKYDLNKLITLPKIMIDILIKSIQVKVRVVTEDLTEKSKRMILNYGHTLGHAIERREKYQIRHGNAVAIGLMFAAELSCVLTKLSVSEVDFHRQLLMHVGLPTKYVSGVFPELLEFMKIDKKAQAQILRFIILDSIARPIILSDPDPAVLLSAYDKIAAY